MANTPFVVFIQRNHVVIVIDPLRDHVYPIAEPPKIVPTSQLYSAPLMLQFQGVKFERSQQELARP
jgi:hypothetical protein